MQELRDLKTRDIEILSETLREMADLKRNVLLWNADLMLSLINRIPEDTYLIYSTDQKQWVFTNILDDDLVYQEHFQNRNFVIVERDVCMALARGIHYRYHKKVRP